MMDKVPLPLLACEATCRRIVSTADELASVFGLIQGCIGIDLYDARKAMLCEIAADLQRHLGLYCAELGIGPSQPETTTEGESVTEVDVDAGGGSPEDTKPPKCSEYHTKRKDSEG